MAKDKECQNCENCRGYRLLDWSRKKFTVILLTSAVVLGAVIGLITIFFG